MGMNGWKFAATYNLNHYLGITADLSGQYNADFLGSNRFFAPAKPFDTHIHNFLFGPTVTYRNHTRIIPFAHFLVGDSHGTIFDNNGFGATSDGFAVAVGGGADLQLTRSLLLRLGQLDYVHTNLNFNNNAFGMSGLPTSQNNFSYSAGIVVRVADEAWMPESSPRPTPRVDLFGGYFFMNFGSGFSSTLRQLAGLTSSEDTNGWAASGTYNVNRDFGATAEFSGQYGGNFGLTNGVYTRVHEYNFLFGPTVSYRNKSRFTPFAHALIGPTRVTALPSSRLAPPEVSTNAFGMEFGGGADVKLYKRLSLRLGQFDYLRTYFSSGYFNGSTSQNSFRYSTGLVVRAF